MYRFFTLTIMIGQILWAQDMVLPPDYISSVLLTGTDSNTFVPVVSKNGSITLCFDDLEADQKDYFYLIEHCDKHWKTSDLVSTEYIRGYNKEQIYDYNNSFNTLQDYTHYRVTIPNKNTKLLLSGNYRMTILNDYDEVLFTRYFIIYEAKMTVGVSVHRARDVFYINAQQSVQFIINHPGLIVQNPQKEIYPVVYQNFDMMTKVEGLKPQFMRKDQLLYKYDAETAFWGGNEYLNFDTKELLMTNNTVAQVISGKQLYESILFQDYPRALETYTYFPDANGAFVVRNIKSNQSDLEADYTWIHFSLKTDEFIGKKVYVYGGFNQFQLTNQNMMAYNTKTQCYEARILLKQGFYNYTYATLDDDGIMNIQDLNGSFDETENDYQVLIYYTKFGSKYDRVIGYGIGNSRHLEQ